MLMKAIVSVLAALTAFTSASAQHYFEIGIRAARERISYIDLSRVMALPARSQDLNMGMQVIHHVNKRLAFMGLTSYNTHRYFGRYELSTNDLPSNVAMMRNQSLEILFGVRLKFMSAARFYPYLDAGVSQYFVTTNEFPESYLISQVPTVNALPELQPRFYNLAIGGSPGIRYKAHEFLSVDLEPIIKWFIIGNTSYDDQISLGWCVSLNYRVGN
jgi:hypothetical protein